MELTLISATTSKVLLIISGVILFFGLVTILIALVRGDGCSADYEDVDDFDDGNHFGQPFNKYY